MTDRRHLSELLEELSFDTSRDRVSIGDIMAWLEERATAALLLIFAFPIALPAPPGVSGILGLPLVYLSFQLMMGRKAWLPAFIAQRSMSQKDFRAMMVRVVPKLARAEKLLAPRHLALTSETAMRGAGAVCLLMSVLLLLPIPLGNMLPAISICIISLGLLGRDGRWMVAGTGLAGVSVAVVYGVVLAFAKAAALLLQSGTVA